MRVALYGNVCNNFYTLAKTLRNELKMDAHLYLHPDVDFQNRPESDDAHLKNNYPEWIHISEKWNPFLFLKRFDRAFIKELNKYDVIFLSDLGVVLSPYLKGNTIFYVTGSDLFKIPFPEKYLSTIKGIKNKLIYYYIGLMQRRGIKKIDKIIAQEFYPFKSCLQELNISNKKISKGYFPLLINTDLINKRDNAWDAIDAFNREQLKQFKFIVFHPSRLIFKRVNELLETWQLKGNDILFYAFKIFIDKYKVKDACIALPDRRYNQDKDTLLEIIKKLGIEKYVVWLNPPTPDGFPRNDLMNFYSISNAVADDFNYGMFGSIVVEGMACEKPTFSYVDDEAMKKMYPWHPIISTKVPEEIADKLYDIYTNPSLANEIGKRSREWVMSFHSIKNGSKIYVENFRKNFQDVLKLNQ